MQRSSSIPATAIAEELKGAEMRKAGFKLSSDVARVAAPPIPVARAWIAQYSNHDSRPLIDVSQGVPGTPPPPSLLDALASSASSPASAKYGPILGEPPLREALATEMIHVYSRTAGKEGGSLDVDVKALDVGISAGCNLAFTSVLMALCEAGDQVILPMPWYFNQQQTIELRGAVCVPLPTSPENSFLPRPVDAEALITPRTRAITLVSPNNPTGAVYPPALLREFALLARRHKIALILDETYRDFVGPSSPHSLFSPKLPVPEGQAPWEWRKHLIHLFSFSKSYAMPGHRLGAVVCGEEMMEYVEKVLDCFQICPPRAAQVALYSQMPHLRPFIASAASSLVARHAALRSTLPPHWKLAAQGGFFAFIRHPFPGKTSREVCARLALEMGVVGLPGSFFAPPDHEGTDKDRWVRIGVANVGEEELRIVGQRLKESEELFGWDVEE